MTTKWIHACALFPHTLSTFPSIRSTHGTPAATIASGRALPSEANRSSVVFKCRAAKIAAYITQMNGFNPRSSSEASFAATERARARSAYRPTRTRYQGWWAESSRCRTSTS